MSISGISVHAGIQDLLNLDATDQGCGSRAVANREGVGAKQIVVALASSG
jgi:hypothetical protein